MPEELIERTRARLARLSDSLHRFSAEWELAGPPATYFFAGYSLLNERVLEENPHLNKKVIREDGRTPSVHLPFSAREIFVRTDARVFGFDQAPGLTAKVIATRPGRSLCRDRIARGALSVRITGSRYVTLPALHRYGKGGTWIVEEFVEGERATPKDLESFLTGGAAMDFYGATARTSPIGRRASTVTLQRDLINLDPRFPRFTERAHLVVGIIHGDMQAHNLLRTTDGRFCVVDMVGARVGPIAVDLARICLARPNLRAAILDFLRQLDPAKKAMPPEFQLALGMVAEWRESILTAKSPKEIDRAAKGVKDFLALMSPALSRGA